MAKSIHLAHPSGVTATGYTGFSWTAFFFGFFVPVVRVDIKWAAICLGVTLVNIFLMTFFIGLLTQFIWWLAFATNYNKWHLDDLKLKGFKESS